MQQLTNPAVSQLREMMRVSPAGRPLSEAFRAQALASANPVAEAIQAQTHSAVKPVIEAMRKHARLASEPLTRSMANAVRTSVAPWAEQIQTSLSANVFRSIQRQRTGISRALQQQFARAALNICPPNLRRIEGLKLADVQAVVMDDGIPLYAVPRTSIARSLIRADSTEEATGHPREEVA